MTERMQTNGGNAASAEPSKDVQLKRMMDEMLKKISTKLTDKNASGDSLLWRMLVDSEPALANVPVDKREQFLNCFVGHFKTQFNNRIDVVFDVEKAHHNDIPTSVKRMGELVHADWNVPPDDGQPLPVWRPTGEPAFDIMPHRIEQVRANDDRLKNKLIEAQKLVKNRIDNVHKMVKKNDSLLKDISKM